MRTRRVSKPRQRSNGQRYKEDRGRDDNTLYLIQVVMWKIFHHYTVGVRAKAEQRDDIGVAESEHSGEFLLDFLREERD